MASASDIKGKYVEKVEVKNGVVTAQMKPSGVNKEIQGKRLSLWARREAGSVKWFCGQPVKRDAGNAGKADDVTKDDAGKKSKPSTCRQPAAINHLPFARNTTRRFQTLPKNQPLPSIT
ncbi:Fimbrial protein MS11-D1 (fragment) [Neisseria gonorrhoeae]